MFIKAGFDTICMSEAELCIKALAVTSRDYAPVFATQRLITDLDTLPIPAWELHANERYWRIGRPHGATKGNDFKYAPLMTSRGCIFKCSYCHISGEQGSIAKFRIKSDERVLRELEVLKAIGVEDVFIEDDTLFGHKSRGVNLLKQIRDFDFRIWAGGLWTTPSDLAVFAIDLMQAYQGEIGHILSPQMAQQMLSPQIRIPDSPICDASGLGVLVQQTRQGPERYVIQEVLGVRAASSGLIRGLGKARR